MLGRATMWLFPSFCWRRGLEGAFTLDCSACPGWLPLLLPLFPCPVIREQSSQQRNCLSGISRSNVFLTRVWSLSRAEGFSRPASGNIKPSGKLYNSWRIRSPFCFLSISDPSLGGIVAYYAQDAPLGNGAMSGSGMFPLLVLMFYL